MISFLHLLPLSAFLKFSYFLPFLLLSLAVPQLFSFFFLLLFSDMKPSVHPLLPSFSISPFLSVPVLSLGAIIFPFFGLPLLFPFPCFSFPILLNVFFPQFLFAFLFHLLLFLFFFFPPISFAFLLL